MVPTPHWFHLSNQVERFRVRVIRVRVIHPESAAGANGASHNGTCGESGIFRLSDYHVKGDAFGIALPPSVVVETIPTRWRVAFILLLVGFITSLVVLGSLLWNRKMSDPAIAASSAPRAVGPLAALWRSFASGEEEPWVIFSNAAFVGRPETGLWEVKVGDGYSGGFLGRQR